MAWNCNHRPTTVGWQCTCSHAGTSAPCTGVPVHESPQSAVFATLTVARGAFSFCQQQTVSLSAYGSMESARCFVSDGVLGLVLELLDPDASLQSAGRVMLQVQRTWLQVAWLGSPWAGGVW